MRCSQFGLTRGKILKLVILSLFLVMVGLETTSALDPNLRINVTPSNIVFNITNPDPLPPYYSSSQQISLVTRHTLKKTQKQWFVGIKAAGPFLIDNMNPANRIPAERLRWSRDGVNFYELSEQWVFVNTYIDRNSRPHIEKITYRLYPDQLYTAGQYTIQINFDVRWTDFPWY